MAEETQPVIGNTGLSCVERGWIKVREHLQLRSHLIRRFPSVCPSTMCAPVRVMGCHCFSAGFRENFIFHSQSLEGAWPLSQSLSPGMLDKPQGLFCTPQPLRDMERQAHWFGLARGSFLKTQDGVWAGQRCSSIG